MTARLIRIYNITHDRERGAAMAEYGLLLALVAIVVMAVMNTFGGTLSDTFGLASDTLTNSPALAPTP